MTLPTADPNPSRAGGTIAAEPDPDSTGISRPAPDLKFEISNFKSKAVIHDETAVAAEDLKFEISNFKSKGGARIPWNPSDSGVVMSRARRRP